MAISRRFTCTIPADDDGFGAITMPFDPREVFGKARAPVVVTIGAHSYRSTIANMGGPPFVPLRKSNREAAGLGPGMRFEVELTLDEAERTVDVPDDLAAALDAIPGARTVWDKMSVSHRREFAEAIEQAKKPETRTKRVEKAVEAVQARLAKAG